LSALLCYSNTFNVPFLFDDTVYIVENPTIKDFGYFMDTSKADGLKIATVTRRYLDTRYVGFLSFWANYKLGGFNPQSYHAVNITLHVLCSMLLYVIVRLTFGTPALRSSALESHQSIIALFTALLFAVHPLQTEAVTYISQRVGLLAAFFYLGSVASYAGSRLNAGRSTKYFLYALCFVSALLAMKSKENAFTLPLALVLYELLFLNTARRKRILLLLPLLLTMAIIPFEYISERLEQGDLSSALSEASRLDTDMPRTDYMLTQFTVIAKYIRLIVFPVGQNLDYNWPEYHSLLAPRVMLSFVLIMAMLSLACLLLYRSRNGDVTQRLAGFGIIWFFLSLSVESSAIPISEIIFEYRVYLPSAGFIVATVTSVFIVVHKLNGRWRKAGQWSIAALSIITITLMGTTYARNTVWQNEISLWGDVVEKSPDKARGHLNLGKAYLDKGLIDKSLEHLLFAVKLAPDSALAHNNLGLAYINNGMPDKGIEHCRKALEFDPNLYLAYNNLGLAYYLKGMTVQAIDNYRTSIKIKPDYAVAYHNLGNVYIQIAQYDNAIKIFDKVMKINPYIAGTYHSLGYSYYMKGNIEEAIKHYKTAIGLQPGKKNTHFALGLAYQKKGLMDKAQEHFQRAQ
jgi:tetratricopeptide (TPR) repeat protein